MATATSRSLWSLVSNQVQVSLEVFVFFLRILRGALDFQVCAHAMAVYSLHLTMKFSSSSHFPGLVGPSAICCSGRGSSPLCLLCIFCFPQAQQHKCVPVPCLCSSEWNTGRAITERGRW